MNDLNVAIIMRLVNRVRGPAQAVERDLERIERRQERVARAQRLVARGAVAGAAAIATVGTAAVRAAIQGEDAWSEANKTLEMTPEQLGRLREGIDEMSGRIPVARAGLIDIAAQAGQIGIRGQEAVLAFTEDAAVMSSTFDIMAGDAAKIMGEWRSQMNYSQDEVRLLADQVNFLGNTTAANSASLANYMGQIVGIADAAGMAEEETLALGAAMIANGRAPEVAATSMRGLFRTMTKGAEDMTSAQESILEKIGLAGQWGDIQRQMAVDSTGAIRRVVEALNTLPEEQRLAAATRLFGEEASRGFGNLLTDADALEQALARISEIAGASGSMLEEFTALSQDVADKWQMLKNVVNAELETTGGTFLDPIRDILDWLIENVPLAIDRMQDLTDRVAVFFDGLGSGFGPERLESLTTALGNLADLLFGATSARGDVDMGEELARTFQNAEDIGAKIGVIYDGLVDLAAGIAAVFDGNWSGAWAKVQPVLTALADFVFPDWLSDFSLADLMPDIDGDAVLDTIRGWFDFEWADVLPLWDWGAIIPDLAGFFEGPGGGGLASVNSKLEAGAISESEAIARLEEVAAGPLTPASRPQINQANARIAELRESMADAQAQVDATHDSVGALGGALEVVAATEAAPRVDTTSIDQALTRAKMLDVRLRSLGIGRTADSPVSEVQERASGGAYGPGWRLVGERGPELSYENRAGFIAHHGQLRQMVDLSDTYRRNLATARPVRTARGGSGATFNLTINAAPGMDERQLARLAAREMRKAAGGGNALHDGGLYDE